MLGRRDHAAHRDAVFSDGAWVTSFSTLIDPRPQVVFQAVSPEPESTRFTLDFGALRTIGLFHFQRLTVTSLATMRLRAGNDPTFATNVFDTGTVTGWPRDKQPFTITPWGELTLNGVYEPEEYFAFGMPRFFIPPQPVLVRYVKVEIFDATAAVPAQIGNFGAYETWQPQFSEFGWSLTFIDESEIQSASYGSRFIVPLGKRRRINIGLSFGSAAGEQMVKEKVIGWLAITGKSTPTVIAVFPDDTLHVEKRAIYGTIVDDVALANPSYAFYQMPITLEQLI